jgi:hypothetical protein
MSKSSTNKQAIKQKLLNYFFNPVYNTFTVAQARARFKIDNVSARINELRKDGFAIYTNRKTLADGRKITYYRLGTPSKRYLKALKAGRVNEAVAALSWRARQSA